MTKVNFEESNTCVLILSNSWKDLSDHIECTIHLRFTNALNSAILDNSLELTFDNLHILKLIFCISIKQTFEWGSMKDSSKMKDSYKMGHLVKNNFQLLQMVFDIRFMQWC